MKSHNTVVIKMIGLTEEQIQEEFSRFFDDLVQKHGEENIGLELVGLEPDSDLDTEILSLAKL